MPDHTLVNREDVDDEVFRTIGQFIYSFSQLELAIRLRLTRKVQVGERREHANFTWQFRETVVREVQAPLLPPQGIVGNPPARLFERLLRIFKFECSSNNYLLVVH